LTARAAQDKTTVVSSLSDSDLAAATAAATGKDVAIVFISADSGEGYITVEGNFGDRNDLKAWHNGDALISAVAGVNKNTIVVANSVGPLILESWIDHPNGQLISSSGRISSADQFSPHSHRTGKF
jgi:beta-glucosidase